jgi:hypothetical protein
VGGASFSILNSLPYWSVNDYYFEDDDSDICQLISQSKLNEIGSLVLSRKP